MKVHRNGQAAILSESERLKIRRCYHSRSHQLIFDIACFTGERWGAVIQLRVDDCYSDRESRTPRDEITFRKNTRKKSAGKEAVTRQVPVHPILKDCLRAFVPPAGVFLFPSRDSNAPITLQNADKQFRQAIERAGLTHKGISTHSTRRTFITRLSEAGIDLRTIMALTGHRSMLSVQKYIEECPRRKLNAIETLSL